MNIRYDDHSLLTVSKMAYDVYPEEIGYPIFPIPMINITHHVYEIASNTVTFY